MPNKVKYISKIEPIKHKSPLGLNVRLEVLQEDATKSFIVYCEHFEMLYQFSQELTTRYERLDKCNNPTDILTILKEITNKTQLDVNLLDYEGLTFFELAEVKNDT